MAIASKALEAALPGLALDVRLERLEVLKGKWRAGVFELSWRTRHLGVGRLRLHTAGCSDNQSKRSADTGSGQVARREKGFHE